MRVTEKNLNYMSRSVLRAIDFKNINVLQPTNVKIQTVPHNQFYRPIKIIIADNIATWQNS